MSEVQEGSSSEKNGKLEDNTLFRDVFIGSGQEDFKEGEETNDLDYRCGLGSFWSPQFLQKFANRFMFILVFSLLSIVGGMSFTYYSSTITTLEKRLKITSETATIMMSGNEVSQIMFSIPLSYLGGKGHRPRWMGLGVLMSSFSCFLLASPHLIYGPGDEARSVTKEYYEQFHTHANHSIIEGYFNSSSNEDKVRQENELVAMEGLCDREGLLDSEKGLECDPSDKTWIPLILIFISQFVAGIGMVLFFALGGPYMDDNMKQTHMPFLLGLSSSFRLIGPVLGYFFGFLCLRIFVSPSLTPKITPDNPKWIGAWWLGWIVLGSVLAAMSVFISVFPKKLRKSNAGKDEKGSLNKEKSFVDTSKEINHQLSERQEVPTHSLTDMKRSLRELLRNKVNLYNTIAGVFYLFPLISFGMFGPKYFEAIYKTNAADASITSVPTIGVQAIGLIVSGALISGFQPSARKLAGFNVFTGISFIVVLVVTTQMVCHQGTSLAFTGGAMSWNENFTQECSKDCNCKQNDFDPMCFHEEDTIFYSPCQAGCVSYDKERGIVGNCSCLPSLEIVLDRGTCTDKADCRTLFIIFVVVRTLISFLDSFGRIGNMLIGYRCVDPKQKALAIGLAVMTISLFASLPSPLLFGAIIDSVCLVWGRKCGGKGNCLLYDSKKFVYAFNLTASGFILVGVIFDSLVWYHVKTLDLYDETKNIHSIQEDKSPGKK